MLESIAPEHQRIRPPVGRDAVPGDDAFPGENWFFYWKSSSSLWKSKLELQIGTGPVIVPVNWALHSTSEGGFDFAEHRPETDLRKLADIVKELGKEVVFLLPFSPVPFLPNGGVPHLLSRNLAQDEEGMIRAVVDSGGAVHKIYSFFDTDTFKGYAKFVRTLGQYFSTTGIDADVWGLEAGSLHGRNFCSFLFDRSPIFQRAFVRYLQESEVEEQVSSENKEEYCYKFYRTIRGAYIEQAALAMGGNWEGTLQVGFLGSAPRDIFERMEIDGGNTSVSAIAAAVCAVVFPSSALIPPADKKGCVNKVLDDFVTTSVVPEFKKSASGSFDESDNLFSPLKLFNIYHLDRDPTLNEHNWNKTQLYSYIQSYYSWTYSDIVRQNFEWEGNEYGSEKVLSEPIHFFQGADLTQANFYNLLKLFMSNGKIIIDRTEIKPKYLKKFEAFFTENTLRVERIKFHVEILRASLAEGWITVIDGTELSKLSYEEAIEFWHRLIGNCNIEHLSIPSSQGVECLWSRRTPTEHELDYEEVRRLSIYNPSSYKRKLSFEVAKNFKILSIREDTGVNLKNGPHNISLELSPGTSVSIEFGVFL